MSDLNTRLQHMLEQDVPGCRIGSILRGLDSDTAEQLERVLSSKISTMRIHKELAMAGIHTSRTTLQNHRNHECRCSQ